MYNICKKFGIQTGDCQKHDTHLKGLLVSYIQQNNLETTERNVNNSKINQSFLCFMPQLCDNNCNA